MSSKIDLQIQYQNLQDGFHTNRNKKIELILPDKSPLNSARPLKSKKPYNSQMNPDLVLEDPIKPNIIINTRRANKSQERDDEELIQTYQSSKKFDEHELVIMKEDGSIEKFVNEDPEVRLS